ncbi:TA system VapC family ribonuclease toxin [Microbacterium sp. SA39]|uniref:TA system VapC family ribonuclease toxin n=1 Tax=Microbacterium sp. SA39 TaxID=1263625 RepID=UPI0005F9B990|nr:TA system VapC family ribonuclease toxin [Microbacterium sp. SA39]KJQ55717.1 Ribonuclease VapC43 [Microbacterium sp. SA39]
MIVPDVSILVYAFRADAAEHSTYAPWLNEAVAREPIGVSDTILSSFVRIVTHPRITTAPAPIEAAMGFTRILLAAPRTQWLTAGAPAWDRLDALSADDAGIRGNLVPDAYLAALCLANNARLATRDRGFGRFPNLKWFDPASEA